MGNEGKEIEFSAEEENASSVVEEVAEASGIGLDRLDLGVEAFCHGISDRKAHKVQKALEVAFEHLGDRLDFMQSAADRPSIPFLKDAFVPQALPFFFLCLYPIRAEARGSHGNASAELGRLPGRRCVWLRMK